MKRRKKREQVYIQINVILLITESLIVFCVILSLKTGDFEKGAKIASLIALYSVLLPSVKYMYHIFKEANFDF